MCALLATTKTMLKKSIKVTNGSHKVYKDIARQFMVGDREMFISEVLEKLAEKKVELLKLLSK